jgi:hypothetical protein
MLSIAKTLPHLLIPFLQTVYKGVRSWSKRTLQWAGEKVMDVPLPEDEKEDEVLPDDPSAHLKTE